MRESVGMDCETGGKNQMDKLNINVIYEKEWDSSCFHLDLPVSYREGYEMSMLRNNCIPGLLIVSGSGRNGESRYTFHTENRMSLEEKYRSSEISGKEILSIVQSLIETSEAVRNYLLDPDCILADPKFVFEKEGTYRFCYLPVKYESLRESFHRMTEFFVEKLNYKDTEGIFLAYRLHKETMQDIYDVRQILEDYKKDAKERNNEKKKKDAVYQERARMDCEELQEDEEDERKCISERSVFTLEDGEDREEDRIYPKRGSAVPVREAYVSYGPLKKVMNKIRTGRWGAWDDFITEMDGHEHIGPL